jgi:hypothetical protein
MIYHRKLGVRGHHLIWHNTLGCAPERTDTKKTLKGSACLAFIALRVCLKQRSNLKPIYLKKHKHSKLRSCNFYILLFKYLLLLGLT